jgi:hypothetical protein
MMAQDVLFFMFVYQKMIQNMYRKIVVFTLVIFSLPAFGGKLEKGFEALFQFDYFKAKEYFERTLEKQPAGSAYGLCKVYGAEKSPFFNVDTAFKYISISDKTYKDTPEKEMVELTGLEINPTTINKEKVKLAPYFFERATDSNTVVAFQDFMDEHPTSNEYDEAEKLRNHLAYLKALEVTSMSEWANYMKDYPEALDYASAKKKFQLLEYQKLTRSDDAYSYQIFIKNKGDNPYVVDAQDEVYKIYTKDKKPDSYEKFIKENPNNKHFKDAWRYLYRCKTSKFTAAAISEFIIDYPDYPYQDKLKLDLELSKMQFIPAKKGELWGFIDTLGIWKIKPQYTWVSSFHEGKSTVGFLGKTVFINKRGGLIYAHLFDDASSFENNLAIVELDDKFGVINYLGDTIVPILYDEIGEFSQGLIYAGRDGKYGYFDTKGEEKISFIYQSAFDFKNNKAIIKQSDGYGVINVLGQPLLPSVYEWIIADSNHYVVKKGNVFGLISVLGDTLLPFEYNAISPFVNDRAIAAKGEKYQYINGKGEVVFKEKYPFDETTMNYSSFYNGYARVKSKGKVGIIDVDGKRVFPAIFKDVGLYNEMLTPVNKTGKWGYANGKIELAIPYNYNYAYNFEFGYAVVENDTSVGLINVENELVLPFGYDKINQLDSNYIVVVKAGMTGLVNYKNEVIVPIEYSDVSITNKEIISFEKDNKIELFLLSSGEVIYREE